MAGTDNVGTIHDELELLVSAGLTPAEALQAATLEPARYLEATDSLGTVEAGKVADLVLLEANPLADISNTQRIAAVVLRGRYLDREALDALLASAERAARAPQISDTVQAAPPTGDREADRGSLVAAIERVRPGGTIAFDAGTYLVGSEGLTLRTPGSRSLGIRMARRSWDAPWRSVQIPAWATPGTWTRRWAISGTCATG